MSKNIDFTCASCGSIQKRKLEINEKEPQIVTIECDMCGSKKIIKITPVPLEVSEEKAMLANREKKVKGYGKEGWKNE